MFYKRKNGSGSINLKYIAFLYHDAREDEPINIQKYITGEENPMIHHYVVFLLSNGRQLFESFDSKKECIDEIERITKMANDDERFIEE
jgi:hypothetical protein